MFELKDQKKAPFHKEDHKDHFHDAELIYASLEYAIEKSYSDFYFLADNASEFGSLAKADAPLHSDISNFASGINIHYFTDIKLMFEEFDILGFPYPITQNAKEFKKIKNIIIVDRQIPLIDQVTKYLEKTFQDCFFLPKQLFAEHYPFIKGDYFEYIHKPFSIITDNDKVYALFKPGENRDESLPNAYTTFDQNYSKKLDWIKQKLFDNQIYRIGFKLEKEIPIVIDSKSEIHNEYLQGFRKHDFLVLLEYLSSNDKNAISGDIKIDLQTAYSYYLVGNYKASSKLLLSIKQNSKDQKNLYYYITCFNISKISRIVQNTYFARNPAEDIAKQCYAIDLDEEKASVKSTTVNAVVDYIYETRFFTDNFYELQKILNDIRAHQFRQNSGFNQNTEHLIEQYFATETFLNDNSIIFDRYEEFAGLVSQYMEGLFASYSCDNYLGGKLISFNDQLLLPMIFYAKPDEIHDHCNRYKIKMASYKSESDAITVQEICINILNQYNIIASKYSEAITIDMPYFFDFYYRRLSNCLVIFSNVDFDQIVINSIAEKLLTFLTIQTHYPFDFLSKWVFLFISKNDQKLSAEILEIYLSIALRHKFLHDEGLFELLYLIFKKRKISLVIPKSELSTVIDNFTGICQSCNETHSWHYLCDIYMSSNSNEQKNYIREVATRVIGNDFDAEKYYLAVLCDVVVSNQFLNDLYFEKTTTLLNEKIIPRYSSSRAFYTDNRIDHLINFCFKLDIEFPETIKGTLLKLGTYYKWLSNM